jgi:AcrR family transcriptional regulator
MPRTEQANQRLREESKKRILDAARKVFARKGTAATMSDVATEAGISQGLAYRYFPSKEAILVSIVSQLAESGGGAAARVERISGSPGRRLGLLVSYILESRREQPEFYQLVYQVMSDDRMPNNLREVVGGSGRVIQSMMRQLILEGQDAGEIAKDDPDQLLGAVLACLDGLSRRMLTLEPEAAKASIPDARVIMRMLRPDPSGGDSRRG